MCGICGFLLPTDGIELVSATRKMTDTLRHRGPDDKGIWVDQDAGVALGHRRLSITELGLAGAQPMTSPCGRYIIAFNGEIYNHLALRDDLAAEGVAPGWRGTSDTETLLAALVHWGIRESLCRAQGMFALAFWDRQAEKLHLARDRMGEKPLYLARLSGGWAFGSELKALLVAPDFEAKLCQDAVTSYLAYGYVPDTQCIFQNVQKISPGHVTTVSLVDAFDATYPFQTFTDLVDKGLAKRSTGNPDELDRLESTLGQVVEEQMLSDVPLGCFLSGGVDSSLIAALMQSRSTLPVRTFAIGFSEERFNEAPHAAAVARHLGTEHTEFILSEQDALGVITDLQDIYDEPFADSSQIPTVLLCREAREAVTVALTGDGGDEVFGGYNRHIIGPKLLSKVKRMPVSLQRSLGRVITTCGSVFIPEDGWLRSIASTMRLPLTAFDKAVQLAPYLGEIDNLQELYQHFVRSTQNPSELLNNENVPIFLDLTSSLQGAEWMMAMDSMTYLPGDILVKVDRAAMAASLETRAPFLDSRVICAAWGLPLQMKISGGKGKQVLRSILDRHVPRDLIERPKQGFAIPLDRWLRGELRTWAEAILSDHALIDLAGLKRSAVSGLWINHQDRSANNGTELWTILMLLDWLSHYRHKLVKSAPSNTQLAEC
jgi:asparagine synthase (glutamine-hydrolysing)